jgi:protein involved in sex pheromone biosynthesis
MFYVKLKEILSKIPNKTTFLKDIGLPGSYLGVRYFLTGKQPKMGDKGLNKLLEAMNHKMVLVPVKIGSEEEAEALDLQKKFLDNLEEYLKKYENDTGRVFGSQLEDASVIEDKLTNLDTTAPVEIDGVQVDLGIDIEDMF